MKRIIRPPQIVGNDCLVFLTKGEVAVVDADMFDQVGRFNWSVRMPRGGRSAKYAITNSESVGGKRSTVYLHHLVLPLEEGMCVDHIDGDGLNCRKANLRYATNAQNQHNQKLAAHNTTGFKGVTWVTSHERFFAQIRVNGQSKFLGSFRDAKEAAAAYDQASRRYFGEYANKGY